MISLRRLRAVFQLAVVSAICWGVAGSLIAAAYMYSIGVPMPATVLIQPFLVFAFCGVIAGAGYAVTLALVPPSRGEQPFSTMRAGTFGALGGIAVIALIGIAFPSLTAAAPMGELLLPGAIFGVLGGGVGIGILQAAKRGTIEPGSDIPNQIAP